MQDSKCYELIKNEEAKIFIHEIPSNIKKKCQIISIKPSEWVVVKGNTIKDIYISLQGEIQVKNEFENGFIYSFAKVESLAYIGVMEVMAQEQVYVSSLQATTECILIKLAKDDFMNWIRSDHQLTLKVLEFIASIMYIQSLNKGEVLAYPAIYSLINYFINCYEKADDEHVYLTQTREEIGSVLGFSSRTINRNLKQLREQELITVNRKNLSINKIQYEKLVDKLQSIK